MLRLPDRGSDFHFKSRNINYSALNPIVIGTHYNCLIETSPMSTHNIAFEIEIMGLEYLHSLSDM